VGSGDEPRVLMSKLDGIIAEREAESALPHRKVSLLERLSGAHARGGGAPSARAPPSRAGGGGGSADGMLCGLPRSLAGLVTQLLATDAASAQADDEALVLGHMCKRDGVATEDRRVRNARALAETKALAYRVREAWSAMHAEVSASATAEKELKAALSHQDRARKLHRQRIYEQKRKKQHKEWMGRRLQPSGRLADAGESGGSVASSRARTPASPELSRGDASRASSPHPMWKSTADPSSTVGKAILDSVAGVASSRLEEQSAGEGAGALVGGAAALHGSPPPVAACAEQVVEPPAVTAPASFRHPSGSEACGISRAPGLLDDGVPSTTTPNILGGVAPGIASLSAPASGVVANLDRRRTAEAEEEDGARGEGEEEEEEEGGGFGSEGYAAFIYIAERLTQAGTRDVSEDDVLDLVNEHLLNLEQREAVEERLKELRGQMMWLKSKIERMRSKGLGNQLYLGGEDGDVADDSAWAAAAATSAREGSLEEKAAALIQARQRGKSTRRLIGVRTGETLSAEKEAIAGRTATAVARGETAKKRLDAIRARLAETLDGLSHLATLAATAGVVHPNEVAEVTPTAGGTQQHRTALRLLATVTDALSDLHRYAAVGQPLPTQRRMLGGSLTPRPPSSVSASLLLSSVAAAAEGPGGGADGASDAGTDTSEPLRREDLKSRSQMPASAFQASGPAAAPVAAHAAATPRAARPTSSSLAAKREAVASVGPARSRGHAQMSRRSLREA
jgi:hypothetical protein